MDKIDEIEKNFTLELCKIIDKIQEQTKIKSLLIYWGETVPDQIYYNIENFQLPKDGSNYLEKAFNLAEEQTQKNVVNLYEVDDIYNIKILNAWGNYWYRTFENDENEGEFVHELFNYRVCARIEDKYKIPVIPTLHDYEKYYNKKLNSIALKTINQSFNEYREAVIASKIQLGLVNSVD